MSGVRVTAEILESNAQIARAMIRALVIEFNKKMGGVITPMQTQIRNLVRGDLQAQPEYNSIAFQGKLAKALGLEDGFASINYVVERIVNGINVDLEKFKVTGSNISAGLSILLQIDSEALMEEPQAYVETEKGELLPWLRWLLIEGSGPIIKGYKIKYAPIPKPRSRSGGAIMIKDDDANWGVPSEFAGTEGDNFITRAFTSAQPKIDNVVKTEVKKVFG